MKVELKNVSFKYDKLSNILDDVSFSIKNSESLAIVGSSGCGKSTLLRLICGLLPNSSSQTFSGEILVNGINIIENARLWDEFRSKGDLGFMFQEPSLLPHLTVENNVNLPLKILRTRETGEEIVSEYLNKTGLYKHKNKLPNQLSGGMKTRVALARTFITKPKILLLDEPFSSLDIVWKSKLYEEVRKLKNLFHTTIIMVTHDIFEAIFFSNKIIVLGDSHKIVGIVSIENWSSTCSYNDVILNFHDKFVFIKQLIEQNNIEGII